MRADGGNPFRDGFDSLDPQAAAKVTTGLLRLELGNVSNVKWIGGGLGEYRIDWGPGYRLYLMQDGEELIILFAGGTKRRQQAAIKGRSEEHTSELQSLMRISYAVFCLKKKIKNQ